MRTLENGHRQRRTFMRKLLVVVVAAVLGWQWFKGYHRESAVVGEPELAQAQDSVAFLLTQSNDQRSTFVCDGRERCSQMTSCAEATYFLKHCPDTKMDGDKDGMPCEDQWCNTN